LFKKEYCMVNKKRESFNKGLDWYKNKTNLFNLESSQFNNQIIPNNENIFAPVGEAIFSKETNFHSLIKYSSSIYSRTFSKIQSKASSAAAIHSVKKKSVSKSSSVSSMTDSRCKYTENNSKSKKLHI
jgi:hypothetical protein